jgi:hypothetical protein
LGMYYYRYAMFFTYMTWLVKVILIVSKSNEESNMTII